MYIASDLSRIISIYRDEKCTKFLDRCSDLFIGVLHSTFFMPYVVLLSIAQSLPVNIYVFSGF